MSTGYRESNSNADRVLEILGLFSEERTVLSDVSVAEELGVARSTAYRYLQSLVRARFLEEHRGDSYALGPRVIELARLARRDMGLIEAALPVMRAEAPNKGNRPTHPARPRSGHLPGARRAAETRADLL